jgi:hypothetical protein
MNKWADYLISHVKKDSNGVITHVVVHIDNGGDAIDGGTVKSESEIIQLLEDGYSVKTIMWEYPKWYEGAPVKRIKGQHKDFLRTERDQTAKDNLDNMIPMYN